MNEPTAIGATDPMAHMGRILRRRGLTSVPTGPIEDEPTPDEPGHPQFHHRQRVSFALDRLAAVAPRRYVNATTSHPEVCAWADQVAADSTTVSSLLLWGDTGTGKTHHAYGAARRIAETGPSRFGFVATTFPDLYAALRPSSASEQERDRVMNRVMTSPLVLLDDLGTTKDSEWTEEITYRVINHRYNQQLPTVVTTNHPPRKLPELMGDRVASRLIGMTTRVHLAGEDRRLS